MPASATNSSGVQNSLNEIVSTVARTNYTVFIFYTQNVQGQLVRTAMKQAGLFGPDYVCIRIPLVVGHTTLNYFCDLLDVLTIPNVQSYIAGNLTNPLNDGCIGFTFGKPTGSVYTQLYDQWAASASNPYPPPAIQNIPLFSWYDVDSLLAFSYGFDKVVICSNYSLPNAFSC